MILDAQGFEYAYMVTRHLRDISLQGITVKHLKVVAIDLGIIMTPAPPPLNLPAWLNAITSENGHEHIESLCIIFDTPRPRKPMDVQLQTLNQAVDRMPNLAYAILGSTDVEWRRHSRDRSGLPSRVPDWTPRPNHRDREILGWWLNMLEPYDAATARKGDPEGVRQLQNSMLARWDEALVPSIEELQMGLSSTASSSV
ncbi:hypothetical protein FS749_003731 [Ceratobasidium sp. UAMH 11750]|nr:hypothetical protein FS749_003731 [Ceratobasidium sp. UAMH 11750]